jgi:hypothetical protein
MRQDPSNPSRNQLPANFNEPELLHAIEASGYPLQGVVASKLQQNFAVTEEWSYIDRDTKEHRSLDVFAYRSLSVDREASVQPSLILLIECKRTSHPYIFFKSIVHRPIPRFPSVAGLPYGRVSIHEQGGKRFLEVPGATALGIDKMPFVEPGPPCCASFAKAVPSGKKVELSGSDPFNSLILPLVKALEHATQLRRAQERPERLFPSLILCISVLDAPIILVEKPEQSADPVLMPWIRVVRQEATSDTTGRKPFCHYGVDVIHVDSLDEIICRHLIPLGEEFARRAVQLREVLFHGGEVANLDKWEWEEIQLKQAK